MKNKFKMSRRKTFFEIRSHSPYLSRLRTTAGLIKSITKFTKHLTSKKTMRPEKNSYERTPNKPNIEANLSPQKAKFTEVV